MSSLPEMWTPRCGMTRMSSCLRSSGYDDGHAHTHTLTTATHTGLGGKAGWASPSHCVYTLQSWPSTHTHTYFVGLAYIDHSVHWMFVGDAPGGPRPARPPRPATWRETLPWIDTQLPCSQCIIVYL